ncbi:MAG: recombination protein RecR [Clostridia bacterium]|nr:recombination protein RecR [Clostridia bacterium]
MNVLSIEKLINLFQKLPGVGYKTAQRYAYKIIDMEPDMAREFARQIIEVKEKIKYCQVCGNFSEEELCPICSSERRDKSIICVVKEPKDVVAFERVKDYNGVYHVLHGCISPMDNKGPDDIRIKELVGRIGAGGVDEIIMATNPDVEGEATAIYIARLLKPLGIKCTRLAQGISIGSDVEYADEITLSKALDQRIEI